MKFGETKTWTFGQIHYGRLRTFKALLYFMMGFKIIRWWVGTDALTLNITPPGDWLWRKIRLPLHRLKAKVTEWMIGEHCIESESLRKHLIDFGINGNKIRVKYTELTTPKTISCQPLILTYYPKCKRNQTYKNWVYGVDIIDELISAEKEVNWLVVHGETDLAPLFPVIDAYIRPTRHDGMPRLIRECKINKIPYYWSENGKPEIEEVLEFLCKIKSNWRPAKKLLRGNKFSNDSIPFF